MGQVARQWQTRNNLANLSKRCALVTKIKCCDWLAMKQCHAHVKEQKPGKWKLGFGCNSESSSSSQIREKTNVPRKSN